MKLDVDARVPFLVAAKPGHTNNRQDSVAQLICADIANGDALGLKIDFQSSVLL